ncbi:hypothetical protein HPB47_011449, partial [Ixodes persulcatus]
SEDDSFPENTFVGEPLVIPRALASVLDKIVVKLDVLTAEVKCLRADNKCLRSQVSILQKQLLERVPQASVPHRNYATATSSLSAGQQKPSTTGTHDAAQRASRGTATATVQRAKDNGQHMEGLDSAGVSERQRADNSTENDGFIMVAPRRSQKPSVGTAKASKVTSVSHAPARKALFVSRLDPTTT